MAIPMRSAEFRSIVAPIMNESFDGVYTQRKDEWKTIFAERKGIPRNYHEEVVLSGFNAAPELPDGAPVTYDSGQSLYVTRYVYRIYGLGYALTKVLVEDGDHISIGQTYSQHLAQSLIETKETLAANVLNLSFNSTQLGGDGVALISNAHPGSGGFSWSNNLVAAALSQTSLEAALIAIHNAYDDTGRRIRLAPDHLTVAPANMFQAEVILKSALRSSSANNDVNPISTTKAFTGGVSVITRLTNPRSWWIHTDAPRGLQLLTRRPLEKSMEGDFETDSMRYKATERYVFGWTNPRTLWGNVGL